MGVRDGGGVFVGSGVLEGNGVMVGGGSGDAVGVVVGVGIGVQVAMTRGTALRVSVQPLSNWAMTPKSELTTPVKGPPPPQSPSKSTSHL